MQTADPTTDPAATLDARDLNCPLPILRARKALAGIAPGEVLRITATDPGSVADFASFCTQTGHVLLSSGQGDGVYLFDIRNA